MRAVGKAGEKKARTARAVSMSIEACMIGCCPNGWPSVNTRMANKYIDRKRKRERERERERDKKRRFYIHIRV